MAFRMVLSGARSCLVGYSGRWVALGQRELVQGAYNPAKLKRGDVLTAVIAAAPANLMRVLLNGKAFRLLTLARTRRGRGSEASELHHSGSVGAVPCAAASHLEGCRLRLWGLIDLEGSCVPLPPSEHSFKII